MLADKETGDVIMRIDDSDGPYDSPVDVSHKLAPELVECGCRQDPGPNFTGETGEHFDRRKPGDEALRTRFRHEPLDFRCAGLGVIALYKCARVEKVPRHQKRSARS